MWWMISFLFLYLSVFRSFPNCKFGDKCLYIHPNCKFDASCTRRDCPFTHASPRNVSSATASGNLWGYVLESEVNSELHLQKLITAYLLNKFPSICENQNFITMSQQPDTGLCSHHVQAPCVTLMSLGFQSGLFPSGFLANILHEFLIAFIYAAWLAHHVLLILST